MTEQKENLKPLEYGIRCIMYYNECIRIAAITINFTNTFPRNTVSLCRLIVPNAINEYFSLGKRSIPRSRLQPIPPVLCCCTAVGVYRNLFSKSIHPFVDVMFWFITLQKLQQLQHGSRQSEGENDSSFSRREFRVVQ